MSLLWLAVCRDRLTTGPVYLSTIPYLTLQQASFQPAQYTTSALVVFNGPFGSQATLANIDFSGVTLNPPYHVLEVWGSPWRLLLSLLLSLRPTSVCFRHEPREACSHLGRYHHTCPPPPPPGPTYTRNNTLHTHPTAVACQVAMFHTMTLSNIHFDGCSADEHATISNVTSFSAEDVEWTLGFQGTALMFRGAQGVAYGANGASFSLSRCKVTGGGLQLLVKLEPIADALGSHSVVITDSSFSGEEGRWPRRFGLCVCVLESAPCVWLSGTHGAHCWGALC